MQEGVSRFDGIDEMSVFRNTQLRLSVLAEIDLAKFYMNRTAISFLKLASAKKKVVFQVH